MLSKSILQTFAVILKIGYKVGAFPYSWDKFKGRVKIVRTKKKLVQWLITFVYIVFNSVFMLVRLIQAACCMEGMSYGKLFINLFNVTTWFTAVFAHINTMLYRKEFGHFINEMLQTAEYFRRQYPHNTARIRSGSSVRKFTYGIYAYSFVQFFIALRTGQTNPKYFLSLMDPKNIPKIFMIAFGVFESYMSFCISSTLLLYVIVFLAYVKNTSCCLDILCDQKPVNIPKYFRILQVGNKHFNLCFKDIIMPMMFMCLLAINIISDYATFRLYHEVKMPAFLGFPMTGLATTFIMIDTFPTSYRMTDGANRLILKTKEHSVRNGFVFKFMNSCRPMVVEVREFFVIKQITIMTFLGIVIDMAINMLITF